MTLDDLERQNRGFYGFLAISGCETHFKSELRRNQLRQNHWDRHRKAVHGVFNTERKFRRFKCQFSRFEETCAREHQRTVPP